MIGYGAISSGMGGADLALVDNVTAMNINPAGLASCCGPQISVGDSIMQPRNHHQDHHGNNLNADSETFHLPLLAWAQPLEDHPIILGFGFFGQGGMGVHYDNLRMPFADMMDLADETDELSSAISYAKITPTIAWHSSDHRLKLGASLNLGYAEAEMALFPNTSIFADNNHDGIISEQGEVAFFGMKMTDCRAYSSSLRLGFQYQFGKLTIGSAYLTATDLNFRHGKTKINYSALGLGTVEYKTEMDGFNWPQQAGVGASYQVNQRLKFVFDIDWIDWSSAIKEVKFNLSSPDNPNVAQQLAVTYPMEWEDQWVFAIGSEYSINDNWLLRLGYNHGNNPVPDDNLLPYFPAISEDHITIGTGIICAAWKIDIALEWALKNSVDSSNSLYCNQGFEEELSQFTTHLMISYSL